VPSAVVIVVLRPPGLLASGAARRVLRRAAPLEHRERVGLLSCGLQCGHQRRVHGFVQRGRRRGQTQGC